MKNIRKRVRNCTKCGKEYRGESACGIGREETNLIFFIGMNPWVKNGKFDFDKGRGITILFNKFKEWNFDGFFFDNIVKCEMPNKKNPNNIHIKNCLPYLEEQILLQRPRYIITFGKFAANAMGYRYTPWEEPERFKVLTIPHFSSILYPGGMKKEEYYEKLRKALFTNYKQMRLF